MSFVPDHFRNRALSYAKLFLAATQILTKRTHLIMNSGTINLVPFRMFRETVLIRKHLQANQHDQVDACVRDLLKD